MLYRRILQILLILSVTFFSDANARGLGVQGVVGKDANSENHYTGGIYLFDSTMNDDVGGYRRLGFVYLTDSSNSIENDYRGIEATMGAMLGNKVPIFAGLGLMGAKTQRCAGTNYSENCKEKYVLGFVPEIGVQFFPFQPASVNLFVKNYILSGSSENFEAVGLSVELNFDYK